ncbi:MAG: copper resistance CopC/CopD family protein [Gaiellaceae bacterium]
MSARTTLLLALALALAFPAAASAHATLEHTYPRFQQELARGPAFVRLSFDQQVKSFPDSIQVVDEVGRPVPGTARSLADRRRVSLPLGHVRKGAYTVRWHVMSADGHVVSGVFTFGVRTAAPPPTEAYGASGPTRTEHVLRWAYFLGLALVVGGLGFRLLVLGRGALPPRLERRFYRTTGLGVVAVLEIGIAAFVFRAEDALQLPFGRLLYGDLSPIAGTRFGAAFIAMTLGFALVAALLYLAWLTERTLLLWPAFLIGVVFASGLSLSGHSAADAGHSWLSELADWVHLTAACLWIGGLVQLVAVVFPAAPELRRGAFVRFSRYATALVALLLAAGIYLSVLRLPHLADLWTQGYGRVLLVKLGLVAVALAWGGFHHAVVRPALEGPGSEGVLSRLPHSLVGESMVGVAILLVAAVLVDSKPPPRPAGPPALQAVRR